MLFRSQVDSFETDLDIDGLDEPFHAIFIRAPRILDFDPSVEVLARHQGAPVLVRKGSCLAASFHPELTDDSRIHALFIRLVSDSTIHAR